MRNSISIKDDVNRIIDNEGLAPKDVTNQLFELSVLAMNNPKRVEKIIKNISAIGNMDYLSVRTVEYFKSQKEKGRINPSVDEKDLLSYISSAYSGFQTTFENMICEMDYEKITVKERCERVRINKKNFY